MKAFKKYWWVLGIVLALGICSCTGLLMLSSPAATSVPTTAPITSTPQPTLSNRIYLQLMQGCVVESRLQSAMKITSDAANALDITTLCAQVVPFGNAVASAQTCLNSLPDPPTDKADDLRFYTSMAVSELGDSAEDLGKFCEGDLVAAEAVIEHLELAAVYFDTATRVYEDNW